MTEYKKQINNLREKLAKANEDLKQKNQEIKGLTTEFQKTVKAFQMTFSKISLPQAVQDYSELFDSKQKKLPNLPNQENKKIPTYFG